MAIGNENAGSGLSALMRIGIGVPVGLIAILAMMILPLPPLVTGDWLTHRGKPTPPAPVTARERLAAPDLHQRLLEQYAAPSIVVNEEYEIVHLSDRAGTFLQVSGGEPTHSLI